MTSRDTYQRHVQRVLRVVHYLWQHPQQETPLAVLADMAHFSPYHFHRTYVAVMGESVGDTRQRRCLCTRLSSGVRHAAGALSSALYPAPATLVLFGERHVHPRIPHP